MLSCNRDIRIFGSDVDMEDLLEILNAEGILFSILELSFVNVDDHEERSNLECDDEALGCSRHCAGLLRYLLP